MKVNYQESEHTKLCHARPGDVVQLVDSNMHVISGVLLVCALEKTSSWKGNGLYSVEGVIFFSVETGLPVSVNSLSQRAVIYRKAEVTLHRALEASNAS